MGRFAEFFQSGGVFLYVVSLLGVAGIAAGIAAVVDRRRPVALACIGIGAACLIAGGLGTYLGIEEAKHAVTMVSAEHRAEALTRGISIAMNTTVWAGLLSAPALLGGFIAFFRGPRRPPA